MYKWVDTVNENNFININTTLYRLARIEMFFVYRKVIVSRLDKN